MSKVIHIHLSAEEHKELQRQAAKDKRTLGNYARVLIVDSLEQRMIRATWRIGPADTKGPR